MAAKAKKVTLATLKKAGNTAGIDPAQIAAWMKLFGPLVTQLLINLVTKNKLKPKVKRGAVAQLNLGNVQDLLYDMLTTHHDDILGWISAGDNVLLSALFGLVGAKNITLAAMLAAYKDRILNEADAVTIDLLDQLIALLKAS